MSDDFGSELRERVESLRYESTYLEPPPTVTSADIADCTCVYSCSDHPPTACSLSGDWHVHPDNGSGTFGRCPVHPYAPGDW